jgi:hypothetical protein
MVDRLAVRVVLDTTHDIFISGDPHPKVAIERTRTIVNPKRITLALQRRQFHRRRAPADA